MRYRPFGATYGMAVSTVSLLLDDRPRTSAREWREVLDAAMGAGINTFELLGQGEPLLEALSQVLKDIERRLLFIAWRAPAIGDLTQTTGMIMNRLGLDYLDLLVLTDPAQVAPAQALRHGRVIRQIGLAGIDQVADHAVAVAGVDCLITPYSLTSSWRDRHRLKLASERNMAVIAHDVLPGALGEDDRPSLIPKGWFRKKPKISAKSAYHFLDESHGWTAEEICLAFALFEPAVTSVRIDADGIDRIVRLAAVPERDLPTGVAAQIEMARFSGGEPG